MSAYRRRARRRRHGGHPLRNGVLAVVVVLIFAGAAAGGAAATWVVKVLKDTPNIGQLNPKPQGSISTVYAGDGTRLGFISSDVLRRPVRGSAIADVLKKATV